MQTKIIQIGNSKGVIILSRYLKVLEMTSHVEIKLENGQILIKPIYEKSKTKVEAKLFKAESEKEYEMHSPDVFDEDTLDDWDW